jgi:hypothetical protein
VGTILSYTIAKKYGEEGQQKLPPNKNYHQTKISERSHFGEVVKIFRFV